MARGKPIEEFLSAKSPLARATDPLMTPLETIRLDRAERFLAERGPELAATELREIRSRDALSSPFLTYLASLHSESGSHLGAFLILGELILRGHEGIEGSYGLRTIFPRSHLTLIRDTARELKLDPILVLSLTKQESAFDTRANSPVGAAGLMQLMHATALDMDGGLSRADLLDPAINVRVGAKYLRKMLDRFDGNAVFALAAYNAGPGAVDRWIRENGRDKGILDFIEKIPFKETREYVSSIIRNYYWYASRLGVGPFRGLDAFWVEPPKS
jgi:soluble lytic murein transglycosylase